MKRVSASPSNLPQALLAGAVIVVATLLLNIPYFALKPGPTQDVARLIRIKGVRTHPVRGRLLLTTVSLQPMTVGAAVRAWIDPAVAVVSRAAIVDPTESDEEVQQRTTEEMDESQLLAAAAALKLLGYEVRQRPAGVRIEDVAADAPAHAVLRRGDVVVRADDRPVKEDTDLIAEVKRHQVGDEIRLRVVRGAESKDLSVKTVGRPERPTEPVIGVVIQTVPEVRLPLAVNIDSMGVGGPSGGLMFGVGIVDLLTPKDMTKGRIIAGTGTIGLDGKVGEVGGILQKIESAKREKADLFLVPAKELRQACSAAGDMRVVAVHDLGQAVETIEGAKVPADRTCRK